MIWVFLLSSSIDVLLSAEESYFSSNRLDCVKANELCLKEPGCSTKYRTMRQCVAGRETNFSMMTGVEAKDECRLALDALKQSPLYNCRCKRGMKKEKTACASTGGSISIYRVRGLASSIVHCKHMKLWIFSFKLQYKVIIIFFPRHCLFLILSNQ